MRMNLADNLVWLRRKRGITQEVIADFLGVTKASVSKWETGLSMPDIMHLPRLASYYDITIDELVGYEAQLTDIQIKEWYERFASEFTKRAFDEVMEEVRDFVRQYYSCYPALLQMIVLLINHYMLAEENKRMEILEETVEICEHIKGQCNDADICYKVKMLRAIVELQRGNPQMTVEELKAYDDLQHKMYGEPESILIQAYQMLGHTDKALEINQVCIFNDVLSLMEYSILYLMSQLSDKTVGSATIERIKHIAEIYELDKLHPNTYLKFKYAEAAFYSVHNMKDEAIVALRMYVEGAIDFVTNALYLHGDEYFDRLDNYFKKMDAYTVTPRDRDTILKSISQDIDNPMFANICGTEEFKQLREQLNKYN